MSRSGIAPSGRRASAGPASISALGGAYYEGTGHEPRAGSHTLARVRRRPNSWRARLRRAAEMHMYTKDSTTQSCLHTCCALAPATIRRLAERYGDASRVPFLKDVEVTLEKVATRSAEPAEPVASAASKSAALSGDGGAPTPVPLLQSAAMPREAALAEAAPEAAPAEPTKAAETAEPAPVKAAEPAEPAPVKAAEPAEPAPVKAAVPAEPAPVKAADLEPARAAPLGVVVPSSFSAGGRVEEPTFSSAEAATLAEPTPFANYGPSHERALAYMRWKRDEAVTADGSLAPSPEMAGDMRLWRFLVSKSSRTLSGIVLESSLESSSNSPDSLRCGVRTGGQELRLRRRRRHVQASCGPSCGTVPAAFT